MIYFICGIAVGFVATIFLAAYVIRRGLQR